MQHVANRNREGAQYVCQCLRFVNTTCMYVPKINQSQMKKRERESQSVREVDKRQAEKQLERSKMRHWTKRTVIVTYLKRKREEGKG